MKKVTTLLSIGAVLLLSLAATSVLSAPPEAVCVPATATNPIVPHDTWSGLEISLKGTAHDPDGDTTLATFEWDFGDGSPTATGPVTNPYVVEAKHVYTGSIGDKFVARLRVWDADGDMGSDDYLVEIKDGASIGVRVNVAIDEGLWRLHKDQWRDVAPDGAPIGYWPYGWSNTAASTGACTEAFEIQGSLPSGDPKKDPYVETVQRGLNYLLLVTRSFPVAQDPWLCPLGNPDMNGNGIGLGSYTEDWHSMYECGITLMAFAGSGSPDVVAATGIPEVKGRRYCDIAQDMVDYLAYCQSDPYTGNFEGGWRYYGNYGMSDNSVTQWPVIGMEAAEANFGLSGLLVPAFLKPELNLWIDFIQNDVYGGSGYTDPWEWMNIAKTGGLLAEMKFVGNNASSARAQQAVEFIYGNWTTDGEHFGSYYALYSVMKGFRLLGIERIHPINDPSGFDWYGDPAWGYARYVVGQQAPDWCWYGGQWTDYPLSSAWAILTLKKTVVQPGPAAQAGPDVPSHPPCPIDVLFDGSGSYHPDPARAIVKYAWDFGDGSPPVEGAVVSHCFPVYYNIDGTIDWTATTRDYVVTLTVVDDNPNGPQSDSDTCTVHITPPPWPPVADADGPYVVRRCRPVILDGLGSYDPNGQFYPDPSHPWHGWLVSWDWDLDNDGLYDDACGQTATWSSCEVGLHIVGLKVTNNFGDTDAIDTAVEVREFVNSPPDCRGAVPSIGTVWPPDHQWVPIDILGVIDPDGDPVTITINAITQDEPVNSNGDGNTSPDGRGVGTSTAAVRAERSGKLNGRVYAIWFTASDGLGGTCSGVVKVCVPHDQGTGQACVDDGQSYDSTEL